MLVAFYQNIKAVNTDCVIILQQFTVLCGKFRVWEFSAELKSFGSLLEFDLVNARKNADCLHLDRVALWLADKEYNQLILWLSPQERIGAGLLALHLCIFITILTSDTSSYATSP